MTDKCGLCDHFEKEEGIFGGCLVKQSEHKDPTTFSSDPACEYFTPRAEKKDEPISFLKHLDNSQHNPPPHIAMFGAPSLLQMFLRSGAPFMMQPAGCNSCSDEESKKKETEGWQNPVIRRTPGRKVIPWDEVKQRIANRKQIGNTDL